jgi:hypothetical protein
MEAFFPCEQISAAECLGLQQEISSIIHVEGSGTALRRWQWLTEI